MDNYDDIENSFDNENNTCDLAAVIAEFPEDDAPGMNIPIKKLSDMFDSVVNKNIASSDDIVNMQVYVRIRPTSNGSSTIKIESDTSITTIAPESSKRAQYTKTEERHYNFTHIYGPSSKQTDVFSKTAAPLLERFLQGDSCVLFAYGMTNAGKTYTIQGTSQEPGVLPRLVSSVLERMDEQSDWELQTSMFEIYQEKIYDLLSNKKDKLSIRDGNGKVEVLKLSSHHVSSAQDAIKLLDEASVRRTKSNTLLNSGSSRSHAVYSLTLVKKDQLPIVFQVVDLAGAERGNRTKATTAQQKEANNINVSLMQLWRCLQGMRKKDQVNPDIIPFRESKLTHILMPLLSRAGLAGTGMVVCVNPQVDDYDETISILSNAALACNIKEIANLGRIGTVAAHPQRTSAGAVLDKKEDAKEKNAISKKRSADGNFAKMAARDSMVCIAKANAANIKRTTSNLRISAPSNANDDIDDDSKVDVADVQSELKSLKIELANLREQNQQLVTQSIARETEIRMEVSEEMAERSSHLLEQIQDLQEQLYSRQSKIDNVTKSCKKIKKRQVEIAAEDSSRDLKEAEEELERVKAAYESDISKLKEDKARLEKEVAEWKAKADSSTKALIEASQSTRTSMDTGSVKVLESTDSAANAFSQRMQRDQRFKKSDEGLQRQASRSSRSPLAPKDGNSPLVRQSLAVEVKGGMKRKSTNDENYSESPMKKLLQTQVSTSSFATDENNIQTTDVNNGGYLKKLRSHFIRG